MKYSKNTIENLTKSLFKAGGKVKAKNVTVKYKKGGDTDPKPEVGSGPTKSKKEQRQDKRAERKEDRNTKKVERKTEKAKKKYLKDNTPVKLVDPSKTPTPTVEFSPDMYKSGMGYEGGAEETMPLPNLVKLVEKKVSGKESYYPKLEDQKKTTEEIVVRGKAGDPYAYKKVGNEYYFMKAPDVIIKASDLKDSKNWKKANLDTDAGKAVMKAVEQYSMNKIGEGPTWKKDWNWTAKDLAHQNKKVVKQ